MNLADFSEVIDAKADGYQDLKFRDTINAHLRPGTLIPFQNNSAQYLTRTASLLQQPISLVVNRNDRKVAQGTVFLDNGIEREELEHETYEYYTV